MSGTSPDERSYTATLATATLTTGTPILSLTKRVTPVGLVAPNDLLTYTLIVTNSGIVTATGVVLSDTIPSGTILVVAPPPALTQTSNVSWSIGTLEVGGTRTFTMVVRATSVVSGSQIVNTALVSSTERITSTARVTNTLGLADVVVSKSVAPLSPTVPGDTVTWTIRYTNTGNMPALNVFITDVVPSTVDWAGGFIATPPLASIVTGTWFTPSLAAGASGSIVFSTTSNITSSLSALLTNTATISTSTAEVTPANNSANATSPVLKIDLGKRVFRSPVNIGETISYTIRITNTGGYTLTGVPLTDTYDAAMLQYVSAMPTATTAAPGQLIWANATGPAGSTLLIGQAIDVDVTFRAISTTGGLSSTNIVTANAAFDSVVTRNPVTATATVRVTSPQLSVRKTSENVGGTPLLPGERITYTIAISNTGDGTATNMTVSDTLPQFTTFVAGSVQITGARQALWAHRRILRATSRSPLGR